MCNATEGFDNPVGFRKQWDQQTDASGFGEG